MNIWDSWWVLIIFFWSDETTNHNLLSFHYDDESWMSFVTITHMSWHQSWWDELNDVFFPIEKTIILIIIWLRDEQSFSTKCWICDHWHYHFYFVHDWLNIFNLFINFQIKWNKFIKQKQNDFVFSQNLFLSSLDLVFVWLVFFFLTKIEFEKKERKSFSQKVSSPNKSSERSDCSPWDDQHNNNECCLVIKQWMRWEKELWRKWSNEINCILKDTEKDNEKLILKSLERQLNHSFSQSFQHRNSFLISQITWDDDTSTSLHIITTIIYF